MRNLRQKLKITIENFNFKEKSREIMLCKMKITIQLKTKNQAKYSEPAFKDYT